MEGTPVGTSTRHKQGRRPKYSDAVIRQARALAARGLERGTIQRLLAVRVPLGSVWYLAHRAPLHDEQEEDH